MSNRILYSPGRIVFIQLILIIGFCVLIARLVYLQIYQDVFLADQVFERLDSNYSLLATRGKILDRNNKILALDVKGFSVGVDLSKFTNSQNQIDYLSKVIKKEPSQLYEILKKKQSGYLEISRNISIKEKELLQRKKIKGIYFRENLRRSYPEKEIISHIVGLTDIDRKGIQGTELIFQNELKGKEGSFEGIKGLKNLKLEGKRIDPQAGKNIKLTIDINIQSIVYHELDKAIKEYKAHSGSVVVIEPNSGEILAIVNYPSFNPLDRRNLDFSALRNRAIFDVFEPGSVLKPLAMSAILESDPSLYSKKINTSPGWIDYEGFTTRDFKDYGLLTASEIIAFSSNVGMIELCKNQNSETLLDYYKKFGIGRYPVSIMLPSSEGYLPHKSQFTSRDKVSSCYGYGLTLSALQIAQAYSVFANGGRFIEFTLFKDSIFDSAIEERVISKEINDLILEMLVKTVNSPKGTAAKAKLTDKIVAGKTGTAREKLNDDTAHTATFAGFVPYDKPELLAVVVLHGVEGDEFSGGKASAPVFSNIMKQIFLIKDLNI